MWNDHTPENKAKWTIGSSDLFRFFSGKSLHFGITIWRSSCQNATSAINLLKCNLAHVLVQLWNLKFFFKFIIFIFRLCHTACEILVPGPGIKPVSPCTASSESSPCWTTREVPWKYDLKIIMYLDTHPKSPSHTWDKIKVNILIQDWILLRLG